MPCTYTGTFEGDRALTTTEALNERERYLCAIVRQLQRDVVSVSTFLRNAAENAEGVDRDEILDWWRTHRSAEMKHLKD